MALLFVAGLAALVIAWIVGRPLVARRRRERLAAAPFPAEWRAILQRNVPLYRRLPPALQARLRRAIAVFVGEKAFVGCAGQPIDDEVRVTIAAQACLLQLRRGTDPFPGLSEVLVYPGAFLVQRVRPEPSGVLLESRQALSGESWSRGRVVLSWEDALAGAADPADGRNVVIHEFAHQLDQEKGHGNGAPWLAGPGRRERWARVLGEAYAELREAAAWGQATLLSSYGASDPAEFFAVASEVFFEQPGPLSERHPALYAELAAFYGVDPRAW